MHYTGDCVLRQDKELEYVLISACLDIHTYWLMSLRIFLLIYLLTCYLLTYLLIYLRIVCRLAISHADAYAHECTCMHLFASSFICLLTYLFTCLLTYFTSLFLTYLFAYLLMRKIKCASGAYN